MGAWITIKYGLLAIILLALILYIGIQAGVGKRLITAQLSHMLSTNEQQVQLRHLHGHIPWDMRLGNVRITQGDAVALEAAEAHLHWSPWELLRGRVTIRSVGVQDIAWYRPLLPFSQKPPAPRTTPFTIPNVAIGTIALPHLFIEKGLFTKIPLQLTAHIEGDSSRAFTMKGKVDVTEGTPTSLDFSLTPSSRSQFVLSAHLSEAAGGLIGGLLKLPKEQEIALDTALKGDLASVNGAFSLKLGEDTLADIAISTSESSHIMLEGRGIMPSFLPVSKKLPTHSWHIDGDILAKDGAWEIHHFVFALPHPQESEGNYAALTMQGSMHLPTRTTSGLALTLELEDIYPFAGMHGKGTAKVAIQGNPAEFTMESDSALTTGKAAYQLQAKGDIKELDSIALSSLKLSEGEAEDDRTILAEGALSYMLSAQTLDTALKGTLTGAVIPGTILNKEATIAWNMNAKGELRDLPITADMTLDRWHPPAALQHFTVSDNAHIKGEVRLTPSTTTIKEAHLESGDFMADITGTVPLTPHKKPKELTAILTHPALSPLEAKVSIIRQKNALTIPTLHIATKNTAIDGTDISLKKNAWQGDIKINSEDIAPLSKWAGVSDSHGSVQATMNLTPTLLNAKAEVRDLLLDSMELGSEMLDVSINNVPSSIVTGKKNLKNTIESASIAITAKNTVWRTVRADSLNATLEKGAFTLAFSGSANDNAVVVNSAGSVTPEALRLATLTGEAGNYPFTLQQPTTLIVKSAKAWELSPFTLTSNTTSITGSGKLDGKAITANAALNNFPLRPLLVDKFPTIGEITANSTMSLKGTPAAPLLRINADIVAEEMTKLVKAGGVPDTLRIDADAILEPKGKSSVLLSHATLKSGEEPLAEATIALPARLSLAPFAFTMDKAQPLTGKVHSEIALSRFNSWLAPMGHRIVANLKSDAKIKGTIAEPKVEGIVALEKLSYTHLTYGLCVREGEVKLELTPQQQLFIRQFTATGDRGRGSLKGSGKVELTAKRVDIAIDAKKAALFCSPLVDGTITGNIKTAGTMDALATHGTLALGKTAITLPSKGASAIPKVDTRYRHTLNKAAAEAVPALPMRFDIQIDIPNQLFVRGRGLDAEFGGGFHIAGNAKAPTIKGRLKNRRGRLALLGSTMTITEGILEFLNDNPRKPYLQLIGNTRTNGTTIVTELSGSLTAPKLKLSSTPSLPQDEILALLLFGRPLDKVTPLQAIQLAQAAASLAKGESGTGMLGSVRDALGVDSLNIGEGADGNPTVGAGKYVTDKVYVGIEQGTTPESRRLSTEIELTPNVTGKTSTNSQGSPSVGLEWRHDY